MKKNFLQILIFAFTMTTSLLQAQTNQYLHFDKVDDFVQVDNASQLIANSNEITMAGWFYHDELSYGQGLYSFRAGGAGTGEMYVIQLNNGTLECRLITTNGFHEFVAPAFSVVPETWQHIAWVYNGSQVGLYIDGNLVGSTAASGTITSTNRPFTIGKTLLGGFNFIFGGRADEVTLWDKALTATEIQDMMNDELVGDEEGLQLYYKMNQGVPGGDNTSIPNLVSEVNTADGAGDLVNFGLTGETSNFNGEIDNSFQAITFPQIPNKLISDVPFQLMAEASSGLPVTYEILSGPATLNGDMVTLDGVVGEVMIKASQPGNGSINPADDVINSFFVIDPATNVPFIDARNPLAGDVFVPTLQPIQLAAISNIAFPELFSVDELKFEIDGEEVIPTNWGNEHYTGWWTPPSFGNFAVNIIATNNFGASAVETVNINITDQVSDMSANAISQAWVNVSDGVEEVEAELPSYLGAFDQIIGNLTIDCPSGGCDPWDRVSHVEAKGHNGEWYEIIRYITPYGVACNSEIDLTDFMSALQGKIRFRVTLGTFDNGFLYSLDLDYKEGVPTYPYTSISEIWRETFDFGNPINLQPVPNLDFEFPQNTIAAKLKLVSTGHGWGENNTDNAAEFHEDTHHIWVDGAQTFAQHNWYNCNPNPDNCSPQNGTWFHDRAGWCPGAIAQWFDYDMTNYVANNSAEMGYVFNQSYVDICHPDNASCVSGVTCPDCNSGFNPHLIVASYMISRGVSPIGTGIVNTQEFTQSLDFKIYPNPASENINIEFPKPLKETEIRVLNSVGQVLIMNQADFVDYNYHLDISELPAGIYSIEILSEKELGVQRLVVE